MKKIAFSTILSCILATSIIAKDDSSNWFSSIFTGNSENKKETTANQLNKLVGFLAEQLAQNDNMKSISDVNIAVASFVNIENFNETSKLGSVISDNLMHDLQVRGYNVVDFKLMNDIKVAKYGDYAYSKMPNRQSSRGANYILTGTYTHFKDGCTINARLVNAQTKTLISTGQVFIPNRIINSVIPDAQIAEMVNNTDFENSTKDKYSTKEEKYIIPDVEVHMVEIKAVDKPNYLQ